MTYRLLSAEEWTKLSKICEGHEHQVPSPITAYAAVAEDDDGVVRGVWFMQLAMHMEPIVLESPYVRYDKLADVLQSAISESKGLVYYCFSELEVVANMLTKLGFSKLPYEVWKKEVV